MKRIRINRPFRNSTKTKCRNIGIDAQCVRNLLRVDGVGCSTHGQGRKCDHRRLHVHLLRSFRFLFKISSFPLRRVQSPRTAHHPSREKYSIPSHVGQNTANYTKTAATPSNRLVFCEDMDSGKRCFRGKNRTVGRDVLALSYATTARFRRLTSLRCRGKSLIGVHLRAAWVYTYEPLRCTPTSRLGVHLEAA